MLETMRLVGKPLLKHKKETEMVIWLEKGQGNERRGQCIQTCRKIDVTCARTCLAGSLRSKREMVR